MIMTLGVYQTDTGIDDSLGVANIWMDKKKKKKNTLQENLY